jgi:hypothetical protein
MDEKSKRTDLSSSRNEGEGNKTAGRQYNEAQRRFVESGQVKDKAREAGEALDGAEMAELQKAEAIGIAPVKIPKSRARTRIGT